MAVFETFSYGIYSLSGGTWTSNNVISVTDFDMTEQGASTIVDTLEPDERMTVLNTTPTTPPDSPFQDLIYRGFFDSTTSAGRMFLFEATNTPGLFLFASKDYDLTGIAAEAVNGTNYPFTIPDASVDKSTNVPFCFVTGTMIATPTGETRVEDLNIGDMICTEDGRDIPVKWIGRQALPFASAMSAKLEPVRIKARALGNGLPTRDLTVSADHGMILDGMVINASALVNGTSITFVPMAEFNTSLVYYHIETEAHDVIIAEGAATETFIDNAGRKAFDNYQDYLDLYGAERMLPEMRLPRISSQRLLPDVLKNRLALPTPKHRAKRSA